MTIGCALEKLLQGCIIYIYIFYFVMVSWGSDTHPSPCNTGK